MPDLPIVYLAHFEEYKILRPAESHALFGAGFVLLGALVTAEALGAGVWLRNRLRAAIFPATLVLLGIGMVGVTVFGPDARIAHFAMGVPMAIGGWAEAKMRFDGMKRGYADIFIIAGLLFAAVEIGLYHLDGPPTSGIFLTHLSLAVSAVVIAGLRFYQGRNPQSLTRSLLVSGAITAIGVQLFVDAAFQP